MANITEEHLHHMARRHHATMQKLDGIRERVSGVVQRSLGAIEMGAGSWIGGMIEGRWNGATVGPVPINLGVGVLLLAGSFANFPNEKVSEHLSHLGNGFVGSYLAAMGYAFGKRWRETGKLIGGGDATWLNPYDDLQRGAAPAAPVPPVGAVHNGNLSPEQMAAIVANMQAAAGAPVAGY